MAGGTAFQPNFAQSNAFEIAGGVAATELQITIGIVQDDDSVSIQFRLPSSGAGRPRRKERYVARYKGEEYEFASYEALEDFVQECQESEKKRPKRFRKPVKIVLTPDFKEEISEYVPVPVNLPKLEPSIALAQVRQIERKLREDRIDEEDEEDILCLI